MEYKPFKIKPNIKKILILNIIKVIIILFIIVFAVFATGLFEFLDVYAEVFKLFNIEIDANNITAIFIVLAIIIFFIIIIINYFILSGLSYEIYPDKIIYRKHSLLIFKSSQEISYRNVTRVYFSREDFINNVFNTGTIFIDLTGLGKKNIRLQFIDNIDQLTTYLHNIVNNYRARMYSVSAGKQIISHATDKKGL